MILPFTDTCRRAAKKAKAARDAKKGKRKRKPSNASTSSLSDDLLDVVQSEDSGDESSSEDEALDALLEEVDVDIQEDDPDGFDLDEELVPEREAADVGLLDAIIKDVEKEYVADSSGKLGCFAVSRVSCLM